MLACPEAAMKFYLFKKISSRIFLPKEFAYFVCFLPDQESALELILKIKIKLMRIFSQEKCRLFFHQPYLI